MRVRGFRENGNEQKRDVAEEGPSQRLSFASLQGRALQESTVVQGGAVPVLL